MGWLDNYGKKENENQSNVSIPKGMVGMANDVRGRKFSPAWGGSFLTGGEIPPRVGAPSEGKYAKKTMPSAQGGRELQYYQTGQDFQPKTISQNGSNISPEQKFTEYLKFNEGIRYKPYKDRKSSEGKITIGAGHKLTPEELRTGQIYGIPYKKGITDEHVDFILQKDLQQHRDSLNAFLTKKHGISLDELSPVKQHTLLDMEFNTGSAGRKFPKFTEAVIKGDYDTQAKEYKRFMTVRGKQVPIEQRNKTFFHQYVSPSMAEDIVTKRIKSGQLQYTPNEESIQQRAEAIVDDRYAHGGVVNDDMGYWNPENWGKPVRINSNNITMRGVNQNLLGISDTGDIKMMEPNKDYTFKGNSVVELPMAYYGVNLQDEKTAQHLDNLTNFTNYNKQAKHGWLSKYE